MNAAASTLRLVTPFWSRFQRPQPGHKCSLSPVMNAATMPDLFRLDSSDLSPAMNAAASFISARF
jgi:hypothetical protein